jgi:uncharacterized membrane protein
MTAIIERPRAHVFHPVHLLLLGGALALFLGALSADIAYARSYQIQWINFAAWLNVGGLVVSTAAFACALFGLAPSRRTRDSMLHAALVLAAWIAALLAALTHARDAWDAMPASLVLSVVVVVLMVVAIWFACRAVRPGALS